MGCSEQVVAGLVLGPMDCFELELLVGLVWDPKGCFGQVGRALDPMDYSELVLVEQAWGPMDYFEQELVEQVLDPMD